MHHWLLKTEPDVYSYADLVREKRTCWDGVANNLALQHMRQVKKGDVCIIYHTGSVKAAVGLATVVKGPYPDPNADDAKRIVFDVKPLQKLENPVTLARIKADPAFVGYDLLRISRLSVVPTPAAMAERIVALSQEKA